MARWLLYESIRTYGIGGIVIDETCFIRNTGLRMEVGGISVGIYPIIF